MCRLTTLLRTAFLLIMMLNCWQNDKLISDLAIASKHDEINCSRIDSLETWLLVKFITKEMSDNLFPWSSYHQDKAKHTFKKLWKFRSPSLNRVTCGLIFFREESFTLNFKSLDRFFTKLPCRHELHAGRRYENVCITRGSEVANPSNTLRGMSSAKFHLQDS